MSGHALLSAHDVTVDFTLPGSGLFGRKRLLRAVDGVTFALQPGQTLGIVGESGCGKSTLARAIVGLVPLSRGSVSFMSMAPGDLDNKALRRRRRELQIIFQDPLASLSPRMTVGHIVAEPLRVHFPEMSKSDRRARVEKALRRVGLSGELINRYPHEFSGGQCQRIGIARALVLEPALIVCDEPVSALDVSVQAQIINLLMRLRDELGLSLIFIAHDLSVVRHISDRILVMYLGRVVEQAATQTLFASPRHPYTRVLIDAIPVADPTRQRARQAPATAPGEIPSPLARLEGCAFRTRCAWARRQCAERVPPLRMYAGSEAACLRLEEISALTAEQGA